MSFTPLRHATCSRVLSIIALIMLCGVAQAVLAHNARAEYLTCPHGPETPVDVDAGSPLTVSFAAILAGCYTFPVAGQPVHVGTTNGWGSAVDENPFGVTSVDTVGQFVTYTPYANVFHGPAAFEILAWTDDLPYGPDGPNYGPGEYEDLWYPVTVHSGLSCTAHAFTVYGSTPGTYRSEGGQDCGASGFGGKYYSTVSGPTDHGSVKDNGDGTFTYTPKISANTDDDAGDDATDTFPVHVKDAGGGSVTETVTVKIQPGLSCEATTLDVNESSSNDVDASDQCTGGTNSHVYLLDAGHPAVNGTVTMKGSDFTYTPTKGTAGKYDSFTVMVIDDAQTAEVVVTVNIHKALDCGGGAFTVGADKTLVYNEQSEGDCTGTGTAPYTFAYDASDIPLNGTVVDLGNGEISYHADQKPAQKRDSVNFRVTDATGDTDTDVVEITIGNDLECEVDNVSVDVDGDVDLDPTCTDSDPDATFTFWTSGVQHGVVTDGDDAGEDAGHTVKDLGKDEAADSLSYTGLETGTDSFTVHAMDESGQTDDATITIRVQDAPDCTDHSYDIDENASLDISAPGSCDGDTGTGPDGAYVYTADRESENGMAIADLGGGHYRYTANTDDSDEFELHTVDNTGRSFDIKVSIDVSHVPSCVTPYVTSTDENDAVTLEPDCRDGGDLKFTLDPSTTPGLGAITKNDDDSLSYMPNLDATGSDTFLVDADDGKGTAFSIPVTVSIVTQEPSCPDEGQTIAPGSATVIYLMCTFPAGDDITGLTFRTPEHGTGRWGGTTDSAAFHYAADATYIGDDAVDVTLMDSDGGTTQFTLTFTMAVPAAVSSCDSSGGTVAAGHETPTTVDLGPGCTILDGDSSAWTVFSAPEHGTATVDSSGVVTYTPDAAYAGSDSVTVQLVTGTATIQLPIEFVVAAPTTTTSGGGAGPGTGSGVGAGATPGSSVAAALPTPPAVADPVPTASVPPAPASQPVTLAAAATPFSVALGKLPKGTTLSSVLKQGLHQSVACPGTCSVTSSVYATATVARRLGLLPKGSHQRGPVLVGMGSGAAVNGTVTVHITLTKRARKALLAAKGLALTETVVAVAGGASATTHSALVLATGH